MITDDFDYSAPGGRMFTVTAGLIAGLDKKSRVLEIASGKGEAACALAERFGCRVEGFDIDPAIVSYAGGKALDRGLTLGIDLGEIIKFEVRDGTKMDFGSGHYDLILAEGGALTFIGREQGIRRCTKLLNNGSYLALTDLIYLKEDVPQGIRKVNENGGAFAYLNECEYRGLLEKHGFEIVHLSMVPQSAWDRYYMSMQRLVSNPNLEISPEFRQIITREIEVYYSQNAMHYVGYVFVVARMARDKTVGAGPENLRVPVLGYPPVKQVPAKKRASSEKVKAPVKRKKAAS